MRSWSISRECECSSLTFVLEVNQSQGQEEQFHESIRKSSFKAMNVPLSIALLHLAYKSSSISVCTDPDRTGLGILLSPGARRVLLISDSQSSDPPMGVHLRVLQVDMLLGGVDVQRSLGANRVTLEDSSPNNATQKHTPRRYAS